MKYRVVTYNRSDHKILGTLDFDNPTDAKAYVERKTKTFDVSLFPELLPSDEYVKGPYRVTKE